MIELPPNWKSVKLGQLCEMTSGGTPSRKITSNFGGKIPWVKSGELTGKTIFETEEYISKEGLRNSSAKIFPKGTILVALYGATIGKLAFLGVDAATNQAICGIFQNTAYSPSYLYYFLFFERPRLIKKGIGGAQPNISQTILKELVIPLPPLPEQHRIVAKIEALFSLLDAGV
ncbi:MAG: restriction endonuclease subunit S, partial [Verrucomicrobiae bacterium]|nr:restriction endonuclease subunit S [Verrucomicrobiae bacterium]